MIPRSLRYAGRELRSAPGRFAFVVLAVALGVGALVGVRSFSQSFRTLLLAQARSLMAGDVALRSSGPALLTLAPPQTAALDALARQHVRWTRITESVSMVATRPGADPILATLKAVDPAAYPFAGAVTTDPPGALARLDAATVLASPDLLLRAGLAPGASVQVGAATFRILGVDQAEPDRLAGGLGLGPRLLLTPAGLRRTGIVQFGSQVSARLLFQLLPGAPPLAQVEARLVSAFPRARLQDYTSINPTVARGLQHATTFLSLVSLVALIVGALGVASAMRAHLDLRLDSIAVLKVLGACNRQILQIFGLQTLLLGLGGGLAGVVVGAAVARAFPRLLAPFFPNLPALAWSWGPAWAGVAAGVLVALLFTLPTLLGLRRVPPAWILRRHVAAAGLRRRGALASAASAALLLAGLAALAAALTNQPADAALRMSGYFLAALAVAVALLGLLTSGLMRCLRAFVGRWSRRGRPPTALRHGLANLYRPGSQAAAVLITLAVGVMFTLSVFLIQRALLADLQRDTPPGVANVFLIDIPAARTQAVEAFLQAQPGRLAAPELLATVAARTPRLRQSVNLAPFAAPPPGIEILRGQWWSAAAPSPARLAVSESFAARARLHLGEGLAFTAAGRSFSATVAAIYRPEPHRLIARISVLVSPGPLDGLPRNVNGGLRLAPAAIPAFERAMFQRFPTVTVLNLADLITRVQTVVNQVALVVHFLAFFAVLAAAVVLASSIAGTRFRRLREMAVLKTFGATRAAVIRIFSVEFALLGLVAGAAGALLALAASSLLARRLLALPLGLSLRSALLPVLAAVAASALLALLTGWLASFRLLQRKPLAILRAE